MDTPWVDDRGQFDIVAFQHDVVRWAARNFPGTHPWVPLLGVVEEVGELAHAEIKAEQGIRGFDDPDKTREAQIDAVGDALVYLANYCGKRGFTMAHAAHVAWSEVSKRDWIANPMDADAIAREHALVDAAPAPPDHQHRDPGDETDADAEVGKAGIVTPFCLHCQRYHHPLGINSCLIRECWYHEHSPSSGKPHDAHPFEVLQGMRRFTYRCPGRSS